MKRPSPKILRWWAALALGFLIAGLHSEGRTHRAVGLMIMEATPLSYWGLWMVGNIGRRPLIELLWPAKSVIERIDRIRRSRNPLGDAFIFYIGNLAASFLAICILIFLIVAVAEGCISCLELWLWVWAPLERTLGAIFPWIEWARYDAPRPDFPLFPKVQTNIRAISTLAACVLTLNFLRNVKPLWLIICAIMRTYSSKHLCDKFSTVALSLAFWGVLIYVISPWEPRLQPSTYHLPLPQLIAEAAISWIAPTLIFLTTFVMSAGIYELLRRGWAAH